MSRIDVKTRIDRNNYSLTDGHHYEEAPITVETVQKYLKELEEAKDDIQKKWWGARYIFQVSDNMIKVIQTEIDKEISYCQFYIEFQERKLTGKLNKWFFLKPDDEDFVGWGGKEKGSQWVITNGKVKAIIQFDNTKKTTGLEVWFTNDTHKLDFFSQYDREKFVKKSRLKNKLSINKRVQEYKRYAVEVLKKHQFPLCNNEKLQFALLKKMLCVE